MQELLNGSQFQKLLEKDSARLLRKYNLKKIDLQMIKYIDRGTSYNTAKDLLELGIFKEEEIIQSLERLRKQNLIDLVEAESREESVGMHLTKAGETLWEQLQHSQQRVTEVLFKGMTEEQIKTFQRLSRNILANIEEELRSES